jgi:signal transduction histidine kinase
MDLLIEQMLETARLEHNRLELSSEKFDVRWAVQEQLDIFRPLSQGHHFVIKAAHEPLLVEGDRTRIATIVANLMDNALKYSPGGGEICITTGRLGGDVFVRIRDEGLGIAPEHKPILFTRFGRLPTEENVSIAGTGLGLFLCKEIAVRHGGNIAVKSSPGAGSEFTLTLPSAR